MAQLVASVSGVVLGGVAEVRISLEAKYEIKKKLKLKDFEPPKMF